MVKFALKYRYNGEEYTTFLFAASSDEAKEIFMSNWKGFHPMFPGFHDPEIISINEYH
jgi:hypothetical protein